MSSKPRTSGEIGDLIESFLDDNESDLSPNMFQALEDLTDDIETIEENYKIEIDELKDEVKNSEERVSELENELESEDE